jgi:hypothetical protein
VSKFLTTGSDGCNQEGIGALVQYQLITYHLSRLHNVGYHFTGFQNLQHFQYYCVEPNVFCKDVDELFNLPTQDENAIDRRLYGMSIESFADGLDSKDNVALMLPPGFLMQGYINRNNNIGIIEEKGYIKQLINNVYLHEQFRYFQPDDFNISLHIRRFTKTDCDPSPMRQLYDPSKNQEILENAKKIVSKYRNRNPVLHVYAQGDESDFKFLDAAADRVKYHVEEYPIISLYHMIHSDVLIMSNSSFSYVAHLLGKPISYVRKDFYHPTYTHNTYYY